MGAGRFDGHGALVTGGGRGIGRAIAGRFAREGARVAVVDVDADAATEAAAALDGGGAGRHLGLCADVADAAGLGAAVEAVAHGLGRLTIVVANAGFGSAKPLDRYTDAEWDRLVAVNLTGVWHVMRAAVAPLRAAGGGSVVTVAGTVASRPTRGEAPYAAAKAGVVALTRVAALEWAPEVRVNCVSPGYIATRLTRAVVDDEGLRSRVESRIPAGRIGTVDDVAAVVSFLCSDDAAYVTGQDIGVDGGSPLPSHQSDELLKALLARWE